MSQQHLDAEKRFDLFMLVYFLEKEWINATTWNYRKSPQQVKTWINKLKEIILSNH